MPCAAMQSDFHTEVHSHRRPNAVAKDMGEGEGIKGSRKVSALQKRGRDSIRLQCNIGMGPLTKLCEVLRCDATWS